MKAIAIYFFLTLFCLAQELPFSRGVNLTNWFQADTPQQIQFQKYTLEDFENIKTLGCDVIRLPLNLNNMTMGEPFLELDPLFLYFLDKAVSYAEQTDIHLILDNHSFNPAIVTDPAIIDTLLPVWKQLAERYKDDYPNLYYEILNEPHGISDELWNSIQQQVINTIREIDTVHTIIVGPAGWNSYHNLQYMPIYEDENLIYTFHFYDPFLFTHQGASWTEPSLVPLSGIPFPYNASQMPNCPPELVGTWIEYALNDYISNGTLSSLTQLIDIPYQFGLDRNIPLFCGEFGVYIPNSDSSQRVLWYGFVKNLLASRNIMWTIWDYHGGFGLFKEEYGGMFEHDLNNPLLEALGLNPQPQTPFIKIPDSSNILLYEDFFGKNIFTDIYTPQGSVSLYSSDNPNTGEYCISWQDGDQYSHLTLDFTKVKDFSFLSSHDFNLEFYIKGDSPGSSLDIRFLDTKTGPDDHPWRMGVTINESIVNWNGTWQHVTIPLSLMQEKGSWDNNNWYEPEGKFDWTEIDKLQIVAEHHSFEDKKFWFDDIKIYNPNSTGNVNKEIVIFDYNLKQNYPNPFNPSTVIEFSIPMYANVKLEVFDILGRRVKLLSNEYFDSGKHKIEFNSEGLSSGIYFYRITSGLFSESKKMILAK